MAKLLILPKGQSSHKIKLRRQYRGLKNFLLISVIMNVCLIGLLVLTTLK